ncbi:MAG TPA: hypothetical protein VMN36_05420 [Verrucomicrobiales bacterium]|nr:hypothetical protein [Verrucomicrobiales bacterium]
MTRGLGRLLLGGALACVSPWNDVPAEQPDTLRYSISPPPGAAQQNAFFGSSVAIDGELTVVGAPGVHGVENSSGAVKVFHSFTGELLHTIRNPDPAPRDHFGGAVSVSGSRLVIGCKDDDTDELDSGSAYLYDLNSAIPAAPLLRFKHPHPSVRSWFGASVLIAGDTVIVGAMGNSQEIRAGGSVFVYDLNSATPGLPKLTLHNPSADWWDGRFGCSTALSGSLLAVGAQGSRQDGIEAAGCAFVYDLSSPVPSEPRGRIDNPEPEEYDWFGNAVAISGTTIAVGAFGDRLRGENAGGVYVFDVSVDLPYEPKVVLRNPQLENHSDFGLSVGIYGSLVVAGVPRISSGDMVGLAHVYDLTRTSPGTPVATLKMPGSGVLSGFGRSVASSGRYIAVGAGGEEGGAYVFELLGGSNVPLVAALEERCPIEGDHFGSSVKISDGRLIAGASGFSGDREHVGIAYVYDLDGGDSTSPAAVLESPSPAQGDAFGSAVDLSGHRAVVGALRGDGGDLDSGEAFVYDLSHDEPSSSVLVLDNPNPSRDGLFGAGVAISGSWVVVGAPSDDTDGDAAGIVYVYDVSRASPGTPVYTIRHPRPLQTAYFGNAVAISGMRVVIGAPGGGSGMVFVYDLDGGSPAVPVLEVRNPEPGGGDFFGGSVAIDGRHMAVGAPRDDHGARDSGSVYAYDLEGPSPNVPVGTFRNPRPAQEDSFGWSVDVYGSRIVAGVPGSDLGGRDSGWAYVFDLDSPTPGEPAAELKKLLPKAGDHFGTSVTIEGTTVAAGVPLDDFVAFDKGAVYIFGPSDGRAPEIRIEQPDGVELATAGTVIPFERSAIGSAGSVRVFRIRNTGSRALTIARLSTAGMQDAEFMIDHTNLTAVVEEGSSIEVSVVFMPCEVGLRVAALHVYSDDADEAFIAIELEGEGVTAAQLWAEAMTGAGLSGDSAAPDATPYNDGTENLLKYAFNMDLSGPSSHTLSPGLGASGLPFIIRGEGGTSGVLRFEFVRRRGSGLTYTPLKSEELNALSWMPLTVRPTVVGIDPQWERVTYEEPGAPESAAELFGRVRVSMP